MKKVLVYYLLMIVYNALYGQSPKDEISPYFFIDYALQEEPDLFAHCEEAFCHSRNALFARKEGMDYYRNVRLSHGYSNTIRSDTTIDCSKYQYKKILKMGLYLNRIKANKVYVSVQYELDSILNDNECFGRLLLGKKDDIILKWHEKTQVWQVCKIKKYIYLMTKDGFLSGKRKRIY